MEHDEDYPRQALVDALHALIIKWRLPFPPGGGNDEASVAFDEAQRLVYEECADELSAILGRFGITLSEQTLRDQVRQLFKEQTSDNGALESKIEEAFQKTFPQFKLAGSSIKITKIDSTADEIVGTLKYTIANMSINSPFIFKQTNGVLVFGEK